MPTILPASGLAAIIDRFDGLIIDQGSIIRDDFSLHPGALDALVHLKSAGTRVVILASSSQSDQANIERLERLGVTPDLYERLISTGHLMRQALIAQSLKGTDESRRYFVAGSPDDKALVDQGRLVRVESVKDADAIILLALSDAELEDPVRIDWLAEAASRSLPIYSAKADVRSPVPRGMLTPGFGAVLNFYRASGGEVFLFGKPSGRVYARCLNILDPIETDRIASIGDQFPADILGARSMGIEPVLVGTGAGGLESDAATDIETWHQALAELCDAQGISDLILMQALAWGSAEGRAH